MTIAIAALCSLSMFAVLTQRSLIGVLVGVQVFFSALVLALVLLVDNGASPEFIDRARSMALLVMVFAQVQALVGLGFAVLQVACWVYIYLRGGKPAATLGKPAATPPLQEAAAVLDVRKPQAGA
jgi:NADH:ubiquinone oxidoreductase subunit K